MVPRMNRRRQSARGRRLTQGQEEEEEEEEIGKWTCGRLVEEGRERDRETCGRLPLGRSLLLCFCLIYSAPSGENLKPC